MGIHGRPQQRWKKRFELQSGRANSWKKTLLKISSLRRLLIILAFLAITPPIFFHFRLRRFQQMQLKRCSWIKNPPLVCAHGGDAANAFPNTMSAYRAALVAQVDCIEIDVSRSSDGILFALHDRDLQHLSRNTTARVGNFNSKQIKEFDANHDNQEISTVEEALRLVSKSVRQVILDAKVGPPDHEKGLAKDILSVVERARCRNCLVWAKSDSLARDVINLTHNIPVGYIVMKDPSTGARSSLLRIKAAEVVGVYHPLIDEKLVHTLLWRNKKVYAWTVDDADSMQKMLFERVHGIVTGHPTLLQRLMHDTRTQCIEEGYSLL